MLYYEYSVVVKKIYFYDFLNMKKELEEYKNNIVSNIIIEVEADLNKKTILNNIVIKLKINFNLENNINNESVVKNEINEINNIIKKFELSIHNEHLSYKYEFCLIRIKPKHLLTMVKELKSYKSDLINLVNDVTINNNNDDILEFCEKNNIKYNYDYRCNIIEIRLDVEFNIKPRKDIWDLLEEYNKIYDEYDNLAEIIGKYEDFSEE